jgi:hypothetical protein
MAQLKKVADGLRPRFPRTATVLEDAAEDVLAYRLFPSDHQRQLHSTNVLERLNKESQAAIERRRDLPVTAPALAERAGALRGDCVRGESVWALVDNRSVVFQAAVDGALSVHGCGSIHAVVELREDARDLHHLTGHYLRL